MKTEVKEANDLLSTAQDEPVLGGTDVQTTEEPAKGEEAQVEGSEGEEAEGAPDSEESEEGAEEGEEGVESPDELTILKQENLDYKTRLDQMTEQMDRVLKMVGEKADTVDTGASAETAPEAVRKLEDIVSDTVFEEMFTDRQSFLNAMNEISRLFNERSVAEATKNIPRMVGAEVNRATVTQQKVNDFYAKNPDLLPHRQFVGYVSNQIAEANPSKTLDQIFGTLAEESRKALGLKAPSGKKRPKSNVATGTGSRRGKQKPAKSTEFEAELDKMAR